MDRIYFHPTEMAEMMLSGKFPTILKHVVGPMMKYRVNERLTHDGIARHSKEEIYQIYEKDLSAIDTYLKHRKSSGGLNIVSSRTIKNIQELNLRRKLLFSVTLQSLFVVLTKSRGKS